MSKDQAAAVRATVDMDGIRAELNEIRGLVRDMAQLVLPAALREACACGLLSCRKVTAVKPGVVSAQDFNLCPSCKLPEGWSVVSNLELGPAERRTVELANQIFARSNAR